MRCRRDLREWRGGISMSANEWSFMKEEFDSDS